MIKWLIIILLAVPRIIYSEIVLLIMNANKEKYPLECDEIYYDNL